METISFHCPACGKSLRVPASAAGQRGPCPSCGEDIIGPQPALGIPARVSLSSSAPFSSTPFPSPAPKPSQQLPTEPPSPPPASESAPSKHTEAPALPFSPPPPEEATHPSQRPSDSQPPQNQPRSEPISLASTPAPAPSSSTSDSSRRLRHLWTAVFLLSCILCTLIAFFAGYLTALYRHQPTAPIFHSATSRATPAPAALVPAAPSTPPLDLEPSPAPSDHLSTSPSNDPPPPAAPEHEPEPEPAPQPPPGAELDSPPESLATLEAFLSAPDWAARLAYVDNDPELHARMKKADEEGESPKLELLDIQPTLLDPEFHHYLVKTKTLPKGFPATLRRTEDGWLVAWDAFHEFSTNRLTRFLNGELGQTGTFRALIRPIESKQEHFATYQITNPIDRSMTLCYARMTPEATNKASTQRGDLSELDQHSDKSALNAGTPAIIDLSQEKTKAGGNYILLKDATLGW